MQDWQKDRNYRKFKNPDGSFTCVITVDGEDAEVSLEVYKAYSQADRRERYLAERDVGRLLSLDGMEEHGDALLYLMGCYAESAEDTVKRAITISEVSEIIAGMTLDERRLLWEVVAGGMPEQAFGDSIGISQAAVNKRKGKLMKKFQSGGY